MKENKIMVIRRIMFDSKTKKKHKITYQSWLKSHRAYFSSMAHGINSTDYKIKTSYADLLHSLIFKSAVFLKFLLTLFFYFYFNFLAASWKDFSSWTRDWTCTSAVEVQTLNHWTTTEVPSAYLLRAMVSHLFCWGEGVTSKTQNRTKQLSLNARQPAP